MWKTASLKPYFYVLNNLVRNTIDPKIGDSINLHENAPKILSSFGTGSRRFSCAKLLCNKIVFASMDTHRSLPYSPYIMHIIENVVGYGFYHDCVHEPYSVRHVGPRGDVAISGVDSSAAAIEAPSRAAPSIGGAAPPRSGRRGSEEGLVKYTLCKLCAAFCYNTERVDRRIARLEENAGIDPPSPLRPFPNPVDEWRL